MEEKDRIKRKIQIMRRDFLFRMSFPIHSILVLAGLTSRQKNIFGLRSSLNRSSIYKHVASLVPFICGVLI